MQKLLVNGIYIPLSKRRRLFGSVDYWLSAEMCFVAIMLEFGIVDSNYFIFLIFLFLFSMQLQLWIWTLYIKTFFWLSLVIQLLQNTSLQIANSLQTQTVFFSLTTEYIYHLLVISAYMFSSIIMITSLLDISVRTKYWN